MKRLFLVPAVLGICAFANAETRLVNGDGSELTELCIAAVESDAAYKAQAARIGNPVQLKNEIECNGMPLDSFVRRYADAKETGAVTYVFRVGDDSDASRLCLAAVRSEQEYEQTRRELFGSYVGLEDEVLCNGKPLNDFRRQYNRKESVLFSSR